MVLSRRDRTTSGRVKIPVGGVDVPSAFLDDLHTIDPRLTVVFVPWRVEFDNVMNSYTGKNDDPRFNLHIEDGNFGSTEIWGWVLKTNKDAPIPHNKWHIFEHHQYGFSHVCEIAPNICSSVLLSSMHTYLHFLARRLFLQAKYKDKYGWKAWLKLLNTDQEKLNAKEKADVNDMMQCVHDENAWLIRSATDNFKSGRTAPVRPQRDIIMSGAGLNKRSRITRDATDAEGGIVLPGDAGWTN